jgi:hypothetical protein
VQVIYWSLYPNGLKIEEKFEHLGSVVNQFRAKIGSTLFIQIFYGAERSGGAVLTKINLAERSVGAVTLKNFGAERSG